MNIISYIAIITSILMIVFSIIKIKKTCKDDSTLTKLRMEFIVMQTQFWIVMLLITVDHVSIFIGEV